MRNLTRTLAVFAVAATLLTASYAPLRAESQNSPLQEPRREKLLNGLRILIANRPGDANVYLKLRIHSGAAFDLANKAGMMALLGDTLFPDPTTREYFVEELGGRLDVSSDYDALDITLVGKASEFERIIELLRTAMVSSQLTPEVVTRMREARVKMVGELNVAPATLADQAISKRLFGDYPYGRAIGGTAESLARIERGDLLLAREKFLNPNNATLVIVGGIEQNRAMRALKQLLGGWRKSDKIVPATFRQPLPPDVRTLIVDLPASDVAEVRVALRGLARSDRDYAAANVLAIVIRDLWVTVQPGLAKNAFSVRHDGHTLPGVFTLGAAVPQGEASATLENARKILQRLTKEGPSPDLLASARAEAIAELRKQSERVEGQVDVWLDADTYQLVSPENRVLQFQSLTAEELKRVAGKLFREDVIASVVLGSAERLKPMLERTGKVEVLSETATLPTPGPRAVPVKNQ